MSGQIFISYRREESRWSARSLHSRLCRDFDPKQIFMDIDAIGLGEDFVRVIETTVAKCDVLIAVLGANWLDVKDRRGVRRLDNPEDYVRMEIGTALRREIRVIPVLVDGALMPWSTDLPEDLRPLVRRNALSITDTSFEGDCQRLVAAIKVDLEKAAAEEQKQLAAEQRENERLAAEQREKERLEAEADAGNVIAMSTLGRLYHDGGLGVARDCAKAREWFQKAADAGDTDAMSRLGDLYRFDFAKAREWYQKAADAGDATGMTGLGGLYERGLGVAQDCHKADEWFHKAPTPTIARRGGGSPDITRRGLTVALQLRSIAHYFACFAAAIFFARRQRISDCIWVAGVAGTPVASGESSSNVSPRFAPHNAQQTKRTGEIIAAVGHALGGRPGQRLMSRLGMPVSADTLMSICT